MPLQAVTFPLYDFTFYKTSEDTLTSFNRKNVGVDITGYGFIGRESRKGIYLRLGIQTPVETLISMGEDFLNFFRGMPLKTNMPSSGETAIISEKTGSPIDISPSVRNGGTPSSTEWKFLISLGPAWRKPMGRNALVYTGVGFTAKADYINEFSSDTGLTYSTFLLDTSVDIDTGFRVSLSLTKTTIRIGFHSITSAFGFRSDTSYDRDRIEKDSEKDFYCYFAGRRGFTGATRSCLYIRLATTLSDNRSDVFSYSNRTATTGGGKLVRIR